MKLDEKLGVDSVCLRGKRETMEALQPLKQLIHFTSLRFRPSSSSFFIVRCCSSTTTEVTGRAAGGGRNRRSSSGTSTSTSDKEAIRAIRIKKVTLLD